MHKHIHMERMRQLVRTSIGESKWQKRAAPVAVKSINQQHQRINSMFRLLYEASDHTGCVLVSVSRETERWRARSEFNVGFEIAKCTHEYRIEYLMQGCNRCLYHSLQTYRHMNVMLHLHTTQKTFMSLCIHLLTNDVPIGFLFLSKGFVVDAISYSDATYIWSDFVCFFFSFSIFFHLHFLLLHEQWALHTSAGASMFDSFVWRYSQTHLSLSHLCEHFVSVRLFPTSTQAQIKSNKCTF